MEYHSSYKVSCENCNRKQKGEKTLCTHNVIAPVIVAPGRADVVSLEPEFIPEETTTRGSGFFGNELHLGL